MSAWFLDSELSTCYYYNHVYQFGTGGLHRSVTFNENKAITFLSFNTTFAYNYITRSFSTLTYIQETLFVAVNMIFVFLL